MTEVQRLRMQMLWGRGAVLAPSVNLRRGIRCGGEKRSEGTLEGEEAYMTAAFMRGAVEEEEAVMTELIRGGAEG
jgi:hypothetical protein